MIDEPSDACARFSAGATELALGLVEGVDADALLEHAASCEACRTELDDLVAAVDRVSLLAPEMEPPVGFESRALAPIAAPATRWTGPRRLLVAAAAVLVVVAAGWWIVRDGSGDGVRTAELSDRRGHEVGRVIVAQGRHLTVLMSIDDAEQGARYRCTVTLADGTRRDLGGWSPTTPTDDWVVGVADLGSDIRTVRVVELGQGEVATANLPD